MKSSLTAQGRVREGRVWVPGGVLCRMGLTPKSTDAGRSIWDLHHLVEVPEKSRGFVVRVHHIVCSPWKQLGLEAGPFQFSILEEHISVMKAHPQRFLVFFKETWNAN